MREEREETFGQNITAIFSRLDPLFALSTNCLKALKNNCLIKAWFMFNLYGVPDQESGIMALFTETPKLISGGRKKNPCGAER